MGPLTLELWRRDPKIRPVLSGAMHVSISSAVQKVVLSIVSAEIEQMASDLQKPKSEAYDAVFEVRMPAPAVCLEFEEENPGVLLLVRDESGWVSVLPFNDEDSSYDFYHRSGPPLSFRSTRDAAKDDNSVLWMNPKFTSGTGSREEHKLRMARMAMSADTTLSLLAEPRLVVRGEPSRSDRRRAQRALGANVPLAWSRVTWTVGAPTKAKDEPGDETHRKALHFCRAHWRRSHEGAPKAELRPGRSGWWTWVEGCFKGHPDFGIKLSTYVPKVDPGGKSAAALSAMAATRNAMVAGWKARNVNR